MNERKRAAILRRMASVGGMRVVCLTCGARGRHMPGERPRLRDRVCARCGTKHPRTVAWVTANPQRAADQAALARLGVFDARH